MATAATHNAITLRWQLDFTGGAKLEEIGYRIRQKKEESENYVYRDVPKVWRGEILKRADKYFPLSGQI